MRAFFCDCYRRVGRVKYRAFHERSQAAYDAQRARIAAAIALTDRQATERELADAEAILAQPVVVKQPEIFGGKA
jgi:hypothetical protein